MRQCEYSLAQKLETS